MLFERYCFSLFNRKGKTVVQDHLSKWFMVFCNHQRSGRISWHHINSKVVIKANLKLVSENILQYCKSLRQTTLTTPPCGTLFSRLILSDNVVHEILSYFGNFQWNSAYDLSFLMCWGYHSSKQYRMPFLCEKLLRLGVPNLEKH